MPSSIVQIPFTGGVNQRTAAEYLDPNTAQLDVVNGVYAYDGAVDKRLGVAPLPTTQLSGDPTMGAPVKLLSRGPELLATDGDSLFSYSPDGTPIWAQRALMAGCVGTRTGAFTVSDAVQGVTMAEGSGRRAYAYVGASRAIYVRIVSIETGAAVLPQTIAFASGGYSPVLVYQAGNFYLFWTDASNNLWGAVYSPNGVATGGTAIVADVVGTNFDATPEVGGPGILVMYPQTDGTGVSAPRYLRLESLPALTITASGVLATGVGTTTLVACRYDGALGVVWMMYESEAAGPTYTLHAQAFTTAWSSIHAVIRVDSTLPGYSTAGSGGAISVEPLTVAGAAGATYGAFFSGTFFGHRGSGATAGCGQVLYAADGTQPHASAGAAEYPHGYFAGRPFRVTVGTTTRCYVPYLLGSQSQTPSGQALTSLVWSYLLMDTMMLGPSGVVGTTVRPRVVCVLAPRQSFLLAAADGRYPVPSGIGAPSSGTFRAVFGVVDSEEYTVPAFVTTTGLQGYTVNVAQFDFTQAVGFSYAEGNGETFVSGGVTAFHDGTAASTILGTTPQQWGLPELSFFSWPIVTGFSASTNVQGSLTLLGAYEYAVCWSQVDAQGLIHRSAFYSINLTLGGSENAVTLTVDDLEFSGRYGEAPIYLEIYRTEANLSTLYFVDAVQSSSSNTAYGTALTYLDLNADVTGGGLTGISTNPLQYTTGGVLDSVCPPSSRHIIRHVDRLWLIDDTGQVIWYSTPFGAGDAIYFNESLTLQFTKETLTALADMDDKIVVFSARSIWYVEGYGPPNTGIGSDLTTSVQVPTDTGAGDWRSVVTVPGVGVFFQSGLNSLVYLLDRGLGVTCVGKQVQTWFQGATVLGSAQVPLTTTIRMLLSTGYVVTYDYTLQRWSRQLYAAALQCTTVPVGGAWTAGSSDGHVYQENASTIAAPYFDTLSTGAQQWVTTTIKLAPLKPGGLQGAGQFDFCQPAARALDPADWLVSASYNYAGSSSAAESRTFHWKDLAVGSPAAPGIILARMSPTGLYSQPMAVSLTLSDAPPTGGVATTGRGMRWLGVAFSVQMVGQVYDQLNAGVRQ